MNINVNVKRKFKINGKEYDSVEEMPSDIRAAFEKAMTSHAGLGKWMNTAVQTKIIFNGEEYQSIDTMPQDVRKLYENVLKAAQGEAAPGGVIAAGDSRGLPGYESHANSITAKPAGIRPAGFNIRTVIIIVSAAAIIMLLYLFFRGA